MSTFHSKYYALFRPEAADVRPGEPGKWVWKLYSTEAGAVRAARKLGGGTAVEVCIEEWRVLHALRLILHNVLSEPTIPLASPPRRG